MIYTRPRAIRTLIQIHEKVGCYYGAKGRPFQSRFEATRMLNLICFHMPVTPWTCDGADFLAFLDGFCQSIISDGHDKPHLSLQAG